jgi:hypothetical protein
LDQQEENRKEENTELTVWGWLSIAAGCLAAWLLGYWLGQREAVKQMKQQMHDAFHPHEGDEHGRDTRN